MPWSPQLTTLRNRLAILFSTQEDARRIVEEAQLDPAHIAFDSKAINNWHNILSQAELRGKVEAVVQVGLGFYSDDHELLAAYQAYMASIGRSITLPSVRPQLAGATPSSFPATVVPKIKILFLAANPRDMDRLKLDEEVRSIDQALRIAAFRDQFELIQHWAVRHGDLQALLLRHQPDIVHFSGHGVADDQIMLMDDKGDSHPVSSRALGALFAALKDNIRCVVLNACYSQTQAEVIAQHIDVVIGMSSAITDEASYHFAAAFYQGLAYGRTVKTAFDLGCVQIDLANLDEQELPQLITRDNDSTQITFAHQLNRNPTT